MSTRCPQCASVLDASTALCRRCGWSAPYLVRQRPARAVEMSFSERYRGTEFDSRPIIAAAPRGEVAKCRVFVIVSSVALLALIIVAGSVILAPPT
jgi:hypothetical protein